MYFLFVAEKWVTLPNAGPKDGYKTETSWTGHGPFIGEDGVESTMRDLIVHPTKPVSQVLCATQAELPRFAASSDKALAAAAAEMLALFPVEGETDQPPV